MAKRADPVPPKLAPASGPAKRSAVPAPGAAGTAPASAGPKKAPRPDTKADASPATEEPAPEDLQAIFGENLKAARLKSGLKQADIAERSGLSQQRLSQIEGGHINLTLKTMMKLAEVLGYKVNSMLKKVQNRRK